MADLPHSERLQPCLLDRLTDLDPGNPNESRAERVMSSSRYRAAVKRDLVWLISTANPNLGVSLEAFPHVATSVINYGMRSLCGMVSASLEMPQIQQEMKAMIEAFEPRLDSSTLSISTIRRNYGDPTHELHFEVHADLWARPIPEEFFVRTMLDLETGDVGISDGAT